MQFQEQLWLNFRSILVYVYIFPSSFSPSPSNIRSLPWRQGSPCDLLRPWLFMLPGAPAKLSSSTPKVPHSLFLRGEKLWLTKVGLGQCLLSWSHQAKRASGSLSKGSLDIKTYHSSLPSVETWHLFQKMPNVFSLHIRCHISDLSLVRSLWKKGKKQASKQTFLCLTCWVILDDLNCLSLSKFTNGHISHPWNRIIVKITYSP